MLTIAFTGKRPKDLYGYKNDNRIYTWCILEIAKAIIPYIKNEQTIEIRTGGAQGADMLAFETANILKTKFNIINTLYLPFPEQPDKWPEYGYFNKNVWYQNKEKADKVTFVYPNNTGNITGKLLGRNTAMITGANRLFAIVKDQTDINAITGGTGHAIQTAIKQKIPITLISFIGSENNPKTILQEINP